MALTLGKLTILVGAGILGSVIAKEGRFSDFVSGAFKITLKQIKHDDTNPTAKKPRNDALIAQVNSLRQELQMLASSSSVTIVNASRSGTSKYGVIVVIVVVGYGYVWWKGWKLPDMMFATRRSLADACTSISKQLENVYSSISATKRRLSSQIDGLDRNLNECLENSTKTQQEISELRGKSDTIGLDVRYVHDAVQELESRINSIEGNQDKATEGVKTLCHFVWNLENSRTTEQIQSSASNSLRLTPELPPISPSSVVKPSSSLRLALDAPPSSPSRTGSLLPVSNSEQLLSSDSDRSYQEGIGVSAAVETPVHRVVSNGINVLEDSNSGASSSGLFGRRFPVFNALMRTRSATSGLLKQTRTSQQP